MSSWSGWHGEYTGVSPRWADRYRHDHQAATLLSILEQRRVAQLYFLPRNYLCFFHPSIVRSKLHVRRQSKIWKSYLFARKLVYPIASSASFLNLFTLFPMRTTPFTSSRRWFVRWSTWSGRRTADYGNLCLRGFGTIRKRGSVLWILRIC